MERAERARRRIRRGSVIDLGGGRLLVLRRREWQIERETGALRRAVHADVAAQQRGDDVVADRQPQAAAALAQLGGEEGVKNLADVLRRDAHAVVGDGDMCVATNWIAERTKLDGHSRVLIEHAGLTLPTGAKAGLVPLHVWLPEAHPAAPSPVSAMMSGIMLKTAIYGILRVTFDLLHTQYQMPMKIFHFLIDQ